MTTEDAHAVSSAGPVRRDAEQPRSTLPVAPPLDVEVVWGHLAQVPGDIHVAGHYLGVMPTAAERALDSAISVPGGRQVIAEHTRRRWLVGALGEVAYFPGLSARTPDSAVTRAAVAGMGRVGTFSPSNAVRLYASVARELAGLACVEHAVVVPIGSGAGNLTIAEVASALVLGCGEGLAGLPPEDRRLRRLSVVELDRLRAEHLHDALREAAEVSDRVQVAPGITTAPGGRVGSDAALVHLVRSQLLRLAQDPADEAAERLLGEVREDLQGELWTQVLAELGSLAQTSARVVDVRVRPSATQGAATAAGGTVTAPTRMTALQTTGDGSLSWSALTARATIPEREVQVDGELLAQLVRRLTAPDERDSRDLPAFLTRFLVPVDLQASLSGEAPLIIEVDRRTARVPWEFLMPAATAAGQPERPLAVQQCFARQMRTSYARTDLDAPAPEEMRALVIGDLGGGALSLPGAREEALAVADVLSRHAIEVDAYIGAVDDTPAKGSRQATRLDVLAKVLTGRYDIVHYAGHGVFDPQAPELTGWLFSDGLLTARELTQLSGAPWLVMANACWSAARPPRGRAGQGPHPERGQEGELAPVLADEFLRVGVGHFIGASWQVPDDSATEFALTFYRRLLGEGQASRDTVGRSLLEARTARWEASRELVHASPEQRNAWAAYQHYGDPSDGLRSKLLSEPAEIRL